jgi:hypothetical protein
VSHEQLVHRLIAVLLGVVGGAILIRAFTGKEFFLSPLASRQLGPRLPNWLARPLVLLIGIGALLLAIGLWRQ